MNIVNFCGVSMVASFFIAIFIVMCNDVGLYITIKMWIVAIFLTAFVVTGVYLSLK